MNDKTELYEAAELKKIVDRHKLMVKQFSDVEWLLAYIATLQHRLQHAEDTAKYFQLEAGKARRLIKREVNE